MTESQFEQMMNLMNKSVNSTQRLEKVVAELKTGQSRVESDVSEIKVRQERIESDISEIKEGQKTLDNGQKRLEREMRANNRAVNELAGENIRIKNRVDMLEEELPH